MPTIVSIIITVIITLSITVTQKYLGTRKYWQLGAVIPIIYAIIMSILFYTMNVKLTAKTIVPCVIILVLELFIWLDSRKGYRQKEFNKMKAKDI